MARPDEGARIHKGKIVAGTIALLVVCVAVYVAWVGYHTPRGSGLLNAMRALLGDPAISGDEKRLGAIILENYEEYRANARNWSAVYFGCLFFSAACAALAGVVIKLELLTNESVKRDAGALLAMVSALLVTLSTAGGFHQRWYVNRLAAAKIEKLGYDFITADRKGELARFSSEIQTISYERNAEIVSGDSRPSKAKE